MPQFDFPNPEPSAKTMNTRFEEDPVTFFPEWQEFRVPYLELAASDLVADADMSTPTALHAAMRAGAIPDPSSPGLGAGVQRQDFTNVLSITPAALLLARACRPKSSSSCPQSPIAKFRRGRISLPELSRCFSIRPGPLLPSPKELEPFPLLMRHESTFLSQPDFPTLDEAGSTHPAASPSPCSSPVLVHSDSARSLCPSTESESEARSSSWPYNHIRRCHSSFLTTISSPSEDRRTHTTTTTASSSFGTPSFRNSPILSDFVPTEFFQCRQWPPIAKQDPSAKIHAEKHDLSFKHKATVKSDAEDLYPSYSSSSSSSRPNPDHRLSPPFTGLPQPYARADLHVTTSTPQAVLLVDAPHEGNHALSSVGEWRLETGSVGTPTLLPDMERNDSANHPSSFVADWSRHTCSGCAESEDDACGTAHLTPQVNVHAHCQSRSSNASQAPADSSFWLAPVKAAAPDLPASTPTPTPSPTPGLAPLPTRVPGPQPSMALFSAASNIGPSTPTSRSRRESTGGGALKLSDISAHFCVPAPKAAELLGVSRTYFKKICRDLGIERWPFRKMSCINKWIEIGAQVLQDPNLEPLERDAVTTCLTSLDDTRKRISSNPNLITDQLLREIRRIIPFNAAVGKPNTDELDSSP